MNNPTLKYIAYVRKSEEREERQQLSIASQVERINETFRDLNIIDFQQETRSAFKPHNRPVFASIIERIKTGEADGIVGWHPNRVSRNEIDAATLTYMLRLSELKDLKFVSYNFENTPEGIWMLQMALSQAQYDSAKQGRDVKRGMRQKVITGERPGPVPIGYMKEPLRDDDGNFIMHKDKFATHTVSDPERFEMTKKMWQLLLTGVYTAPQIRNIANEEWNFTVKKVRKVGGGPMGQSSIYRMFTNPFYAGYINHLDELHKGSHEAMITLDEFDYAQKLLGAKGKPRSGVNEYAYTGLIKCGECGCQIVGKTNKKYVKREGKVKMYVHYHCTRRSIKRQCNQSRYTSLEQLESEIEAELAQYTILPEFKDLALDILRRDNNFEASQRSKVYESQQSRRKQIQQELDKLVKMHLKELLDENEYAEQRRQLKGELTKIDEHLRSTEHRSDKWIELTEQAFNFALYAPVHFKTGDLRTKREILMSLGEGFILKDNRLTLTPHKWLAPISKSYPAIEAEYKSVATKSKGFAEPKTVALAAVYNSWRAIWDSNPGHED